MKKVLLATVAAVILSSASVHAAENVFYAKIHGGWAKLSDMKFKNDDGGSDKLKGKNGGIIGVGVGYHVMDNMRVDLMFDSLLQPTHKLSVADGSGLKAEVKAKGTVHTLMVNAYVDVVDIDPVKMFVGAGVGLGMAKSKLSGTLTDSAGQKISNEATAKQKNSFAWALHAGVTGELTPGTNIDLSYSYRDMGKTKKSETVKALNYKGHMVTAGLRYNI